MSKYGIPSLYNNVYFLEILGDPVVISWQSGNCTKVCSKFFFKLVECCYISSFSIFSGAFVAALEYSTDKTASIVGKPSEEFFRQSIADFDDVNLEDCVMIGDVSQACIYRHCLR